MAIEDGGIHRFTTGLALSGNGVEFSDQGTVLDIGGSWKWWWADTDLFHQTGSTDPFGWGWFADTSSDAPGYLCYGSEIPAKRIATLEVD